MNSMSNDDVIALFKNIEQIKNDTSLTQQQISKTISSINDKIVKELAFLVYNNTKFYRKFPNYEDLVQEGFIGLIKAVRKFDYNRYPNFFLYAAQWIKHSVKRAASRFDIVYNPERKRVVYSEVDNQDEEIDYTTPEDTFLTKETQSKVREVINEFSERDREIINRIFGLNNNNLPQTLREIGPDFNLTYERVRQIKNHVLSKLKNNQELNKLI